MNSANAARIGAIELHDPTWEPQSYRMVWDTSYAAPYSGPHKGIGDEYQWTGEEYSDLRYSLDQSLPQEKTRNAALERIAILACDSQDTKLASCNGAKKRPTQPDEGGDGRKRWKRRAPMGRHIRAPSMRRGGTSHAQAIMQFIF
jgi:hypothetical protein